MQVFYFNSFLRLFKKTPSHKKDAIREAIERFIPCLETNAAVPEGFGLKKLTQELWEIRAGIDLRIIFTIESDALTFIYIGNHDAIRNYIKHRK